MPGKPIKSVLIGGLAIAACMSSTAVAVALGSPQSAFANALGLAQTHEARATRFAGSATPSDLDRARTETVLTLRQAPANSTAWLRLAYLDSASPGGFGARANTALSRSYSVAPYGPDDTAWRLAFAFNHWSALTVSNRKQALEELSYIAAQRSPKVAKLREDVTNPAGYLALSLTLSSISARIEAEDRLP